MEKIKKYLTGFLAFALIFSFLSLPNLASGGQVLGLTTKVANLSAGEKTWVSETNAKPGDQLAFYVSVRNLSAEILTNVKVKANLPNGLGLVPGSVTVGNQKIGNTIASAGIILTQIKPGQAIPIVYQAKLANPLEEGVIRVTHTAEVNGTEITDQGALVTILSSITAAKEEGSNSNEANLSLTVKVGNYSKKTDWAKEVVANPGDEIVYLLKVENKGETTVRGIRASVSLPAGMELIQGLTKLYKTSIPEILPDTITISGVDLPDLAPGSWIYLSYKTVLSTDLLNGTVLAPVNKITASDLTLTDDSARVIIQGEARAAQLELTVKVGNYSKKTDWAKEVVANPGDEIVYLLKVKNTGETTVRGIRASVFLPNGMDLVPGVTKLWKTSIPEIMPNTITTSGLDLPSLAPGSWIYLSYKVVLSTDLLNGTILAPVNKITASDLTLTDDSARVIIQGEARAAQLELTVKVGNYSKKTDWAKEVVANPGDEIVYLLKIKNVGTTTIGDIKAYANLPAGMQLVPGLTKLYRTSEPDILPNTITSTGVDLPVLTPGSWIYVSYKVKLSNTGFENGDKLIVTNRVTAGSINLTDSSTVVTIQGVVAQKPEEEQKEEAKEQPEKEAAKEEPIKELPKTGPETSVLALLSGLTIAGYLALKEKRALKRALKRIK